MSQLEFPLKFKRQYSGSLDVDQTFETLTIMNNYLTNPLRYAGQIVYCVEDENVYYLKNDRDVWVEVGDKFETIVDDSLSLVSENPVQNKVITDALNGKQSTLTAGDNIDITDNVISATGGEQFIESVDDSITVDEDGQASVTNPLPVATASSTLQANLLNSVCFFSELGRATSGLCIKKLTGGTFSDNQLPNNLTSNDAYVSATINNSTAYLALNGTITRWNCSSDNRSWQYEKPNMQGNFLVVGFNLIPKTGSIVLTSGGVDYTVKTYNNTDDDRVSFTTSTGKFNGHITGLPPVFIADYYTEFVYLGCGITTIDKIKINIGTRFGGNNGITEVGFFTASDLIFDEVVTFDANGLRQKDPLTGNQVDLFNPIIRQFETHKSLVSGDWVLAAGQLVNTISTGTVTFPSAFVTGAVNVVTNTSPSNITKFHSGAINRYYFNNGEVLTNTPMNIPHREGILLVNVSETDTPIISVFKSWADLVKFPTTKVERTEPNYIDWYEESQLTDITITNITFTDDILDCVIVGQLAHISGSLTISATTATGNIDITGLPYEAKVKSAISVIVLNTTDVGSYRWVAYVEGTTLKIRLIDPANGTYKDSADYLTDTSEIILGGSYRSEG